MQKSLIVANWKANMTVEEIQRWFTEITSNDQKEVVVCPPFHHLSYVYELIKKGELPFSLGSQDVSVFDTGAFTGEEPAVLLKEFVTYAIIGHSERRSKLHENDELLMQKVQKALSVGITPIFCVPDEKTPIPEGVSIVAYEPVFAIGTGTPDTPENADQLAQTLKSHPSVKQVLYGGSVTAENVAHFTRMPHIDGVLIGKASLSVDLFTPLITAS